MNIKKIFFQAIFFLSVTYAYPQTIEYNADESKAGTYTLPDPLILSGNSKVKTVKQWEKQRLAWLKLFGEKMYGLTPQKKIKLRFETIEVKNNALNNQAVRKRINIYFDEYPALLPIELILYVPKQIEKPAPVFVSLNYTGNHGITAETDIPISDRWLSNKSDRVVDNKANEKARGMQSWRWPLEAILSRGYAVATAYYGDIEPDHLNGWESGIRSVLGDTTRTDNWGAIGVWAWGMSRILDYLETDRSVDKYKAIGLGHSRLGKATLWAGAQDERFAMVISNDSGEGGAALSKRNFGETISNFAEKVPFWFCKNYFNFCNNTDSLPFDQHMLLSLIAPRPLYIASASKDLWADPKGEFLGALNAEEVYNLYGRTGLGTDVWPSVNTPVGETIGYHQRDGVHDILLYDWERFMDFADRSFSRKGASNRR
jgi:hypothetical protein